MTEYLSIRQGRVPTSKSKSGRCLIIFQWAGGGELIVTVSCTARQSDLSKFGRILNSQAKRNLRYQAR